METIQERGGEGFFLPLLEIKTEAKEKNDRKEYFKQRYQTKKDYWKQKYMVKKTELSEKTKQTRSRYYKAENIQVLFSLKDYTELGENEKKTWLKFAWTLKELADKGSSDIIEVMRLREVMENLISDYWEKAKRDIRIKRNWNKLTSEQQQKRIEKFAEECEREEKEILEQLEPIREKRKRKMEQKSLDEFRNLKENDKDNGGYDDNGSDV